MDNAVRFKLVSEAEVKVQVEETRGPQGPAGPRGEKGEQGDKGERGQQGAVGATPNITFEAVTGPAGTDVKIVQSGTAEYPHVKLTIPRGDTGAIDGVDYYEGDPKALGTASPGSVNGVARGDHVHPTPSASQVGALGKGEQAVDSAKLGGKPPEYYLQPMNLLDNSDFEVAQVGYNGYHGGILYHADRWSGNGIGSLSVSGKVKTFTSVAGFGIMRQDLWNDGRDHGKTYTLVVTWPDGSRLAASGTSPDAASAGEIVLAEVYSADRRCWAMIMKNPDDYFSVRVDASQTGAAISFLSIDLFEGVFTAESAPPHVPKGYAAELMECRRYYRQLYGFAARAYNVSPSVRYYRIPIEAPMRDGVNPSVEIVELIETPLDSWNSTGAALEVAFTSPGNFTISAAGDMPGEDFVLRADVRISSDL